MVRRLVLMTVFVAACVHAQISHAVLLPIMSAGSDVVNVGDTFTIPISITGAVDLDAWQFDLSFNQTVLQANSVTEGPFLSSSGTNTTLFISCCIDNGNGTITGISDSLIGVFTGPSGNGDLAYIEFKALMAGISVLTLSNAFVTENNVVLWSGNGDFTLQPGVVCVNGPTNPCAPGGGGNPVPEPSTVALLSLGLGALAFRRRLTKGATHQPGGN